MKAILLKSISRPTWDIHLKKGQEVDVEIVDGEKGDYRIHVRGPLYIGVDETHFKFLENKENEMV